MTAIVKELSGIPLALEQAGALIRDGEFSFSHFHSVYKTEYRRLMESHPQDGFWSYDKSRVITTILDMTYSSLKSDPEDAALLDFIGVLGSWQIPISLIEGFQLIDADSPDPIGGDMTILKQLLRNSNFLRLALRRLTSLCLIKLKEEGGRIKSFMIHRVMCQWCVDNVITERKQGYIIQAAYGLAKGIVDSVETNHPPWDIRDQRVRYNYLAPLEHCISLVRRHVLPDHMDPRQGQFLEAYMIIISHVAWAYLSVGLTEEAKKCFNESIELEIIKASEQGIQWPNSEISLSLLSGLARAYQKAGDMDKALETLNTALSLSEKLYGLFNETSVAIVSRLKEVSEKLEVMQRHQKSAVIASTDASMYRKATEGTQQSSGSQDDFLQQSSSSVPVNQSMEAEWDEPLELERELAAEVLQCATYEDEQAMVALLLSLPNMNINLEDEQGRTPLLMAAGRGHARVVQLMLEKDTVGIDAQGRHYGNALCLASEAGHEQVVKLLLDKGAEVNAQGGTYGNAFCVASRLGHEQVVKLLLDRGAEVNTQGGPFGNALQAASEAGHEQVVKLLLNKGAEVNAQGGTYGNALQAASRLGHERVVKLLLDKGAEVNAQGGTYGNALQAASRLGHEWVVKLLLNKGAEVNTQGGLFGNALQAASEAGHEQVVKLLLDKGAEVNTQGGPFGNALQAASEAGHEQVVKLLLNKGAEVNAQGGTYGNALQAASGLGHERVVKLLLDEGAEVNARGGLFSNALQAASEAGHKQVVELLLDKGAEVNAQGGTYGNALQAAPIEGHHQIVTLLRDKGAEFNVQGGHYGNAVQADSGEGHKQVVNLLLDKEKKRRKPWKNLFQRFRR
jgi:ankyrin repeat protein